MASYQVLENKILGISIGAGNAGTSPIPDHVSISEKSGDNITLTLEQFKGLCVMCKDLLDFINEKESKYARR